MKNFRFHSIIFAILFMVCACIVAFVTTGCGDKQPNFVEKGKIAKDTDVKAGAPSFAPITEERVYYDFESDLGGWEVPIWALNKSDYVAREEVLVSEDVASQGNTSMKFTANFPKGVWSAALIDIQQFLDLSPYRVVCADIYLPAEAPLGLKAKLILTVGENWKFVEMARSVPLIPGQWVTITANIEPGSYDWKRVVPDKKFAEDVRKVAIRVECNREPAYDGPIYVDNIRCCK